MLEFYERLVWDHKGYLDTKLDYATQLGCAYNDLSDYTYVSCEGLQLVKMQQNYRAN